MSGRDWWEKYATRDHLRWPKELNHPIRKMMAKEAIKIGGSVLDVGCGTCIDYPLYEGTGISYIRLDITQKFLNRARELYPGINVKHGDATHLPFPNEFFDTTICKDLLEHLPPHKWKLATHEMWRVARELVMIAFFMPPWEAETVYEFLDRGHWSNQYNKDEIIDFINDLPELEDFEIRDKVGRRIASLYILRKKPCK